MSNTSWSLWLHEHVWPHVLSAGYRLERGGMEGGDTRADKMGAKLWRSVSFCLLPEKLNHRLDFFFFYKQGADCSPGAPEAKNRSVSSGSYATMAKIRLIHLSLVLKAWWLLFWKCAAWIMFSFNYHSFNYCVCVQVPEEGPSPPLTHNQEI